MIELRRLEASSMKLQIYRQYAVAQGFINEKIWKLKLFKYSLPECMFFAIERYASTKFK